MKRQHLFTLAAAGAVAAILAACTPPHPHPHITPPMKSIARLDCPDEIGDLSRVGQTSDGLSCSYKDGDNALVDLKLLALTGTDPKAVLDPVEKDLRAELPPPSAAPATNAVAVSSGGGRDEVHINVPGVHINVDSHGANVGTRDSSVVANEHGAEIRHESSRDSGINIGFLMASDVAGPHGYHAIAYEARGPVAGPLVVAVVRQKERSDGDDTLRDVKKLLKHNLY